MNAPEADRTRNSRQENHEIDTCPRTVMIASQETFFDTCWLSVFGTDHAPAQFNQISKGNNARVATVLHQMAYGRLMVGEQKRTLLWAHGEGQSVTQAPQHPNSTELEENATHFAAGPGDYHWLTARVPSGLTLAQSFVLHIKPLFVGVHPRWGIELL